MSNDWTKYTKDQLKGLSDEIWAEIRSREAVEKAVAIRKFAAGDKVYFTHSKTGTVFATVTKVLRTNVDVISDGGRPWRVPANILHATDPKLSSSTNKANI